MPRSRGSTVPAGSSLQATRLISSARRPVGSEATPRSPGRPQRGLEVVAAVLYGQAGAALLDTYHNERHPIGLLTICSRPLPGSAPAWVKAPRCPTHRLWGGDDGLAVPGSSAVLGASEDISPLLPKELAGEPGTRAPHVALTFGGREISTIETCTDCASCCLLAGANGAA
jgi:putative polyketide hydroxylase